MAWLIFYKIIAEIAEIAEIAGIAGIAGILDISKPRRLRVVCDYNEQPKRGCYYYMDIYRSRPSRVFSVVAPVLVVSFWRICMLYICGSHIHRNLMARCEHGK